jgi:hypothetical protein
MKAIQKIIALSAVAASLSGCGMLQSYNQGLDNSQRTFERQQAVLDAANQVQIAKLNVQAAQQQAAVNIAIATGKAKAQEIQTSSLRPLFVQQELVDAIAAGKVQTLVLPASSMLPLNLQGAVQADQK